MKYRTNHLTVPAAVALCLLGANVAVADNGHSQGHGLHKATGLVQQVRESTEAYHDVNVALSDGYGPFLGCVSGPQEGAMGIHYVNGELVGDGVLDAEHPEILIYEPRSKGPLRFVGVEYIVIAADWDANNDNPPALLGQVFHYSGSPNRYGLPPFYALHVWAWRENPHGTYVDWNPHVSCDQYAPQE